MTSAADPVIDATMLGKTFGPTRALDGLDLSVAAGEVHGFLGPNGAGKSTTLRVLLGLIRPTSGTVRVFGLDEAVTAYELLEVGAIDGRAVVSPSTEYRP